MSGDVQPRKRKDKRKRRDDRKSEGDVTILRQSSFQDDDDSSSHGVHITKMGNDDVHLHVQHQHGTGGHWCAKIIFFSLMAVLLGLVGLIIMENRGIEDLDTPLSESRYSNYFDGWVEEHRAEEHDEHGEHLSHEAALDEHDDEHDDEVEEPYEQHSGEEEEAEQEHEEDANDEDDEEEEENTAAENVTAEDDEEKDEDDDIAESADRTQSLADDAEEEEEEADEEEEEEEDADDDIEESIEPIASKSRAQSAPETVEDDEEDDNIEEEQEEEDEDEEEEQAESVEPTISKSQAADDDDEQDNDEDAAEEEDEELEESAEPAAQSVPDDDDDEFEQADNDEDEFESLDQDVDTQAEQLKAKEAKDQAAEENIEAVTTTSWLGSLAVKFGVGIALALVSRLVLIRNNPNTTDEQQPTPETQMRRRLTIATAEDHIPDDDTEELPPLDDEAYSEEEIEIEEEIEVETSDIEECDDNVALTARYVPETFEQLSAMFRPKTESQPSEKESEKEPEPQPEPEVEAEREPETEPEAEGTAASDIYVEYEDGDIEDYEHDDSEDDDELISDEEEDEISDVDDADLMSRLEAKYGRLPAKEYESDPDSDDPSWTQIKPKEPTGAKFVEDELFEQELRRAQAEMINENHANALRAFNTLTHTYAHKPLAHLRRAQALERIAELRRSNQLLMDAIESYKRYLAFDESITNIDYRTAGERCIEHMRFLGQTQPAVAIHELLIERYPDEVQLRNQLSLTYLMSNNLIKLQQVSRDTLKRWPRDPLAQLHFGLTLKQVDGDYAQALPYLQRAIDSQAAGTQEPYFYLALGETLQRLGKQAEALQLYERGVMRGYFASVYQRSLYNVPRLRAKPFWQITDTDQAKELKQLQQSWRSIRNEALALLNVEGNFQLEAEQLRDSGNWQQFELFARGQRLHRNCQRAPITCALLEKLPAASGCRRGQIKFSAMQAQTHVWPHCGPTNCRLRAHLTLVAPEPHLTSLRVADQERTWHEGDLFIFDDSFEHEVWHNGTQLRLVLILDLWHPDLTAQQRRELTPI
ncbi:PREDICTED: aspartyl/asparaginyl beta-hydroxylase isoform X3 [Drosophila arizonae]|uniref:Aspartyl/asparaginyl beta-hydroxylase isoform X3 n=1 Tax=Drosophila arizonae TaxID=7263 RepID=A0ABM1PDR5_DROAR|nr:PREDICTED: aspartyl/asparaginyl beta-hydroxylase isoform X3 [Drosophila arizonae]